MLQQSRNLSLSAYAELYDMLIPKNNLLRRFKDLCGDFDFIYDELKEKYCPDNGRKAVDPIILFKYLLLKSIYTLSDVDVVEHSRYDLSFKYFLGLAPEDDVIDPSTLCKFRTQRLKDVNLLDELIARSMKIAIENGIINSKDIIIDSTHTLSRANPQSPLAVLRQYGKLLRKTLYGFDPDAKGKLPQKYEGSDLKKEMEYQTNLILTVENLPQSVLPAVSEKLNLLREKVSDVQDHYTTSRDSDARTGHKSQDSAYFGYKTHIGMTPEGLIAAATITSGEKADGPQMQDLLDKSISNGLEVDTIIGDGAYCGSDNLTESQKKGVKVVSKLNALVRRGNIKPGFEYNKDADVFVCPAGHSSIRKIGGGKNVTNYIFDINKKCECCSQREGCFREGQKKKSVSVILKSEQKREQLQFEETDFFKEKYRLRYKIEAKNSDLKNNHGFKRAISYGLEAVTLQGAAAIFVCNLKRIVRILDENKAK